MLPQKEPFGKIRPFFGLMIVIVIFSLVSWLKAGGDIDLFLPMVFQSETGIPQLPDLLVSHVSITLEDPTCYHPGDPFGIRVWVKNEGTADAAAFVVDVNGVQQTVATGLSVGQTISLWFQVSSLQPVVLVDATFLITELNEENNIFSDPVPIPTLPVPCTATPTETHTASPTPLPPTQTATPSATWTPLPSATNTPTHTPTPGPTSTSTVTATPTSTNTSTITYTPAPSPTPVSVSFYSVASHDGYVEETGENTNTGGSISSTDTTVRLGDTNTRHQYKTILSFDTSAIPDGSSIVSAQLQIKRQGIPSFGSIFS